jgi:hypothetical protein
MLYSSHYILEERLMINEKMKNIGVISKKWGVSEKKAWLSGQTIKRSYMDDVVFKLELLKDQFDVEQYGRLVYESGHYPLYVIKSRNLDAKKPTVLVTGGVHGYETSGVHGALRFLEKNAELFCKQFNILVVPCVSPWSYETINRWNPEAIDPNRSFIQESPAQESAALMRYIASLNLVITGHIDLHETTDTDNTEFRPNLSARDGVELPIWEIPGGFYLVGNEERPAYEFQKSIIESVKEITHIAPVDDEGKIIGVLISQKGVINYATKKLGLCIGFTNGIYSTTTEVYPDSPKVTSEECINAQVAAITGGIEYISRQI